MFVLGGVRLAEAQALQQALGGDEGWRRLSLGSTCLTSPDIVYDQLFSWRPVVQ